MTRTNIVVHIGLFPLVSKCTNAGKHFYISYTFQISIGTRTSAIEGPILYMFQEAVPWDSWMSSNSCSATKTQESASRDETEELILPFKISESLGELSISVVHCTSGVIPT